MAQEITTNHSFETSNPNFTVHSDLPMKPFVYATSSHGTIIEIDEKYENCSDELKLSMLTSLNDWIHSEMIKILKSIK